MQIYGHDGGDPADNRVAAGKQSAVERTIADRHDPFWIRRRVVRALERLAHVPGHRPGHQQHVGVPRRCDEAQAEAFEVVEGVVERVDLELAAVAGASIDLTNRQAAAEPTPGSAIDARAQLGQRLLAGDRRRLGERTAQEALEQNPTHSLISLKVVSGIGTVERLVAEREVGDDIAFDDGLQQRPLEPGRIAQVAAGNALVRERQPHQHGPAERLRHPEPFARRAARVDLGADRAARQGLQHLIDQREALLDLADAYPDPRVDVAGIEHGNFKRKCVVGGIAGQLARVEGTSAGAADVAAGPELPRQLTGQYARGGGAVLQGRGVGVELDQLGERASNLRRERRYLRDAGGAGLARDATGDYGVHHQAMAEAGIGGAQYSFAQDAAMRMHERERCVIADSADVTEMVAEALELGHQRTQKDRARRNLDLGRRFDGVSERERVGDRAVARGAAGQPRGRVEGCARHQPLDALVHVAEALFQPHYRLAAGGEAEVPGLDDAGVHGTDGDLVQALALDRQEDVGHAPRRRWTAPPERMLHVPEAEVEPRPGIGQAHRLDAVEVAQRALQPDRGRVQHADRWKASARA